MKGKCVSMLSHSTQLQDLCPYHLDHTTYRRKDRMDKAGCVEVPCIYLSEGQWKETTQRICRISGLVFGAYSWLRRLEGQSAVLYKVRVPHAERNRSCGWAHLPRALERLLDYSLVDVIVTHVMSTTWVSFDFVLLCVGWCVCVCLYLKTRD